MKRKYSILLWLIISLILFLVFGFSSGNYIYTFYFLSFFIPVIIATSWMLNSVLVPRYLLKRSYGKFALYSFYTVVVSLNAEMILVFVSFLLMSVYDYENMSSIIDHYKMMPVLMYLIVCFIGLVGVLQQVLQMRKELEAHSMPEAVFTIRSDRKNRRIQQSSVVYIESMSDYILIVLENGEKVQTREKISAMEKILSSNFTRIHRSYIVNDDKLESFSKEVMTIGGKAFPVSRTYKKKVMEKYREYL